MRKAVVVASVVLAGCGARSTLETSASQSSSSSSGGPCTPLRLTPPVGVSAPAGRQLSPALVDTGADGAGATLVFSWTPPEMSAGPARVRHASFDPWGAWPVAAIEPVHVVAAGGASLAAAPEADGSFALLFGGPLLAVEPPGNVTLDLGLAPDQDGFHAPLVVDPAADVASFLATGSPHLVGIEQRRPLMPFGQAHQLDVGIGRAASTGTVFEGPIHLGCSTDSIAAAAVPAAGGGWLVALTNSTPLGEVGCFEDTAIGPATQIQVAFVDPLLGAEQRSSWGSLPDPATFPSGMSAIALAPRPGGGAWLTWSAAATGPGTEAAIRVASLGPGGEWLGDVSVTDHVDLEGGGQPGEAGFTAVPLGDRLALGWLYLPDVTFDVAPVLIIEIVDAAGAVLGWTIIPAEGVINAPPTLIASPAGDAVLVAWSAAPTLGQDERVHAVRVDCLPGTP